MTTAGPPRLLDAADPAHARWTVPAHCAVCGATDPALLQRVNAGGPPGEVLCPEHRDAALLRLGEPRSTGGLRRCTGCSAFGVVAQYPAEPMIHQHTPVVWACRPCLTRSIIALAAGHFAHCREHVALLASVSEENR